MIIVNRFNTSQMKKYIIGSLAIATIAIAGWNFNQKSEVQLTDLALDNVEALASGEGGGGYCSKSGMGCIIRFSDGTSTYIDGRWN